MRSAALDLSWYQYFLLDVIAVLALVGGSALLVVFLVMRTVLRKVCSCTGRRDDTDSALIKEKRN
jgi:hypothetical protein